MKILMLSAHFNQSIDSVPIGGVQKHISGLTDALRLMGHEVVWEYPSNLFKEDNWLTMKQINKDYEEQNENMFDVVLAHDFYCFQYNLNVPQVIIFHGWEGVCPLNPVVVEKRRKISEDADAVINVGKSIVKMYGSKEGEVLYGGITLPKGFKPKEPREEKKNLLILARIEKDNLLLPALELAKKFNWHVDICGDGKEEIKQEMKNIWHDITFHGFVQDPTPFIENADICCLGGFMAMIEYMVHKKIVIGFYDNPMRKCRLESAGNIFKIFIGETVEEVEKQLNKAYKKGIDKVIDKNYKWAMKQSWENIAKRYLGVIENARKTYLNRKLNS